MNNHFAWCFPLLSLAFKFSQDVSCTPNILTDFRINTFGIVFPMGIYWQYLKLCLFLWWFVQTCDSLSLFWWSLPVLLISFSLCCAGWSYGCAGVAASISRADADAAIILSPLNPADPFLIYLIVVCSALRKLVDLSCAVLPIPDLMWHCNLFCVF